MSIKTTPAARSKLSPQASLLVAASFAFAFVSLTSEWGAMEALPAYVGAGAAALSLLLFLTTSAAPVVVVAALIAAALDVATVNRHAHGDHSSVGVWYGLLAMILLVIAGSLPVAQSPSSNDLARAEAA